ncbi:MAG: hypothetical protein FJ148_27490 [Deltaproteobacteria bacterium]|nr:hypothetical protein [Deltaproteobacteria bacterium]
MLRRIPTLLLAALVIVTSVALGTCPVGRCASMQADAAPRAAAPEPQHHDHAAMEHAGHGARHAMAHGSHGAHAMPHAEGGARHAMHAPAADAHDCCAGDGIGAPPCCPDAMQLAEHAAPASVGRASAGVALVATQPVPASLASFPTATADPPRVAPPGAPPGTLIAQHTSILV